MDVNLRVPAIEKLMDYTASGIGSVAGPMLATWRARREAEALRLSAQGEADSMRIIAEAQADARSLLVSSDSTVSGELDLTQTVNQRIQFQEEKRQRNIAAVVRQAAEELGDKEVPDSDTDHDWTARFFSDVQDVSSEELQHLWAKVLAGEVERPGSTSFRALSILRNLDQASATLFRKLCSACVSLKLDGNRFLNARVISLGGAPGQNSLRKYGLSYDNLNALNEHGLIISDYNSRYDYKMCIGTIVPTTGFGEVLYIPLRFQNLYWILTPKAQRESKQELMLSGVALTRAGRELSSIVDLEPLPEYTQALEGFFESRNLTMTEVPDGQPRVYPI